MGLLASVVLGPVRFVTWTADRILQAAQEQVFDERAVMAELARLNAAYDRGLIDGDAFAVSEDELIERLEAARRWSAG